MAKGAKSKTTKNKRETQQIDEQYKLQGAKDEVAKRRDWANDVHGRGTHRTGKGRTREA